MQGLAQVEAVEGLVQDQDGLGREQGQGQQQPAAIALGKFGDPFGQHRLELQPADHRRLPLRAQAVQLAEEPGGAPDRLVAPRRDAVGQVEHRLPPARRRQRRAVETDFAAVGGQQAHQAFHQRRLAGAVGADDAENLAGRKIEVHAVEHGGLAVAFDHPAHRQQGRRLGHFTFTLPETGSTLSFTSLPWASRASIS